MATIVLFHSVLGLRPIELSTAARFEASGHTVCTPDLFGGNTAATPEEGFAIMDEIGWESICDRARAALDGIPQTAVLAGFSMGVGVVSALWPERPKAAGVLLLHGLADIPAIVNPGFRAQVHLADPDRYVRRGQLEEWKHRVGLAAEIFLYPQAGHFFTDSSLEDFDADNAEQAWSRTLTFLGSLEGSTEDLSG